MVSFFRAPKRALSDETYCSRPVVGLVWYAWIRAVSFFWDGLTMYLAWISKEKQRLKAEVYRNEHVHHGIKKPEVIFVGNSIEALIREVKRYTVGKPLNIVKDKLSGGNGDNIHF